jgi:hypothetical protein
LSAQGQLIAEWRSGLERTAASVSDLTGGLSDRQLLWAPPEGGWSVAQVLEHLAITNEQYLSAIRKALTAASPPAGRVWRPSLAGRMLAHSLQSTRKVPAPRAFKPAPAASPASRERFLQSVNDLLAQLDRASAADLRTRTLSPAARMIPLNLGDAFRLQILHADRHLQQIRRIQDRPQFPN